MRPPLRLFDHFSRARESHRLTRGPAASPRLGATDEWRLGAYFVAEPPPLQPLSLSLPLSLPASASLSGSLSLPRGGRGQPGL